MVTYSIMKFEMPYFKVNENRSHDQVKFTRKYERYKNGTYRKLIKLWCVCVRGGAWPTKTIREKR